MFPGGHSRNTEVSLDEVLRHKFKLLGKIGLEKNDLITFVTNLANISEMTNDDLHEIYDCNIKFAEHPIDGAVGYNKIPVQH